jgi:putative glutamate/gamma-aminobutyrate antiporter
MTPKSPASNKRVLGVFTLAMINVAAIISLRNLPVMAEYGLAMIFYYAASTFLFFLPVAFVSAELATAWPETGGVYVWVKEAFGPHWGFLAIWMQAVNNVVWFPTVLAFIAGTLAFVIAPDLAENRYYTLAVVLVVFWCATLVNLRGMKLSGIISSVGTMIGTVFPGVLIIVLGAAWILSGNNSATPITAKSLLPDLSGLNQIVFFAGSLVALTGMEMSAVHAQEVKNPQRDYPKAILLSSVVILGLSTLGSMAIALVVPKNSMSLDAGIMQAFKIVLDSMNLSWLVPVTGFLVAAGAIAMVSTWIVGPAKGLMATSHQGDLPPVFQGCNKEGMPINIMIIQAIVVSLFALAFILMPSVNSAYWVLTILTAEAYMIMYALMFLAAIVLRFKRPEVKRPYRVPGGKIGMFIVAGAGFLTSLFAIIIGFIPPAGQETGGLLQYELILCGGLIILAAPPFIFVACRKPEWSRINNNA